MKPPKKPVATEKINKSAFVRSLPSSMSAGDVVKAAKAKGIKLSDKFVHTIRYNAKKSAEKKNAKRALGGGEIPVPLAMRGPGRPRKASASAADVGGLVGIIEAMATEMVNAALNEKLSKLFG